MLLVQNVLEKKIPFVAMNILEKKYSKKSTIVASQYHRKNILEKSKQVDWNVLDKIYLKNPHLSFKIMFVGLRVLEKNIFNNPYWWVTMSLKKSKQQCLQK